MFVVDGELEQELIEVSVASLGTLPKTYVDSRKMFVIVGDVEGVLVGVRCNVTRAHYEKHLCYCYSW